MLNPYRIFEHQVYLYLKKRQKKYFRQDNKVVIVRNIVAEEIQNLLSTRWQHT